MVKFKIFFGHRKSHPDMPDETADAKLNKWLEEHPDVVLVTVKYQHTTNWHHSICVGYKEDV